jgi:hypothetical protein
MTVGRFGREFSQKALRKELEDWNRLSAAISHVAHAC